MKKRSFPVGPILLALTIAFLGVTVALFLLHPPAQTQTTPTETSGMEEIPQELLEEIDEIVRNG